MRYADKSNAFVLMRYKVLISTGVDKDIADCGAELRRRKIGRHTPITTVVINWCYSIKESIYHRIHGYI